MLHFYVILNFAWHVWVCIARRTNGRFNKEEKAKGKCGIPKKPQQWVPPEIVPNSSAEVRTRSMEALVAEYKRQRQNDDSILEVLAQFSAEIDDIFNKLPAPESQHSVGSMDTCNINLWDVVFRDEAWRLVKPIKKQHGFDATQPGRNQKNASIVPMTNMLTHLLGVYTDWTLAQKRWAVLVPNRFLSEASFHTGDTLSWTQGDVIGKSVHVRTCKKTVLVNLGGMTLSGT